MDIEVTRLVVGPFQQNCRIVRDRASGEAAVIDPGDDAERILATVERLDARVRYVLATHAHLDHVAAAAPVKRALGAPFALHGADAPLLQQLAHQAAAFGMEGVEVPEIDIDLAVETRLPFADGEIEVVPTPGHTPGGVTFLFGAQGFFGDSLFQGSIGRTDLGGDARVYEKTLRETILGLPDETVVYTGHGPDTTIGAERRTNPFLTGRIPIA